MRIGVVQCTHIPDDARRVGDAIVQRLRWADDDDISLIIFPEAFLLVHSDAPETIRPRANVAAFAIAALCERLAAFRSTLVIGAFDLVGEQVFNGAIIIEAGRLWADIARRTRTSRGWPPALTSDVPAIRHPVRREHLQRCQPFRRRAVHRRPGRAADHLPPEQYAATGDSRSLAREKLGKPDRPRAPNWLLGRVSRRDRHVGNIVSYGCTAIVTPEGSVVTRVPELREGVPVYDAPSG